MPANPVLHLPRHPGAEQNDGAWSVHIDTDRGAFGFVGPAYYRYLSFNLLGYIVYILVYIKSPNLVFLENVLAYIRPQAISKNPGPSNPELYVKTTSWFSWNTY